MVILRGTPDYKGNLEFKDSKKKKKEEEKEF